MEINSKIHNIKGIGPAKSKLLYNLGIETIKDALFYFPRDYWDLLPLTFKQGASDKIGAFPCIVTGQAVNKKAISGLYITRLPVTDGQSKAYAVFFNKPFIKNYFYKNQRLLLIGKVKNNTGIYEITNPEWIDMNKFRHQELEPIRPIYPLTKGVSQNFIRKTIKSAMKMVDKVEEILPVSIIKKFDLMTIKEALINIHFPKSFTLLEKARNRFVFEELLLFQLKNALFRHYLKTKKRKNVYKDFDLSPFLSNIPFKPTKGQEKVLNEIIKDLKSEYNMNRLVQGDVGSGKTFIASAALYLSVKNGLQGVMMAPTEILAQQHYQTLKGFLSGHGIDVEILKGGISEKQRNGILERLKKGQIDVLVGTHAVIQKDVEFDKLGMVVTDEQHRFGVKQREDLVHKGYYPDVLVMSATPIPRTIAMVLYNDMDISVIDTLPPGRQKVQTYVVQDYMRKRVYDFMASEVKKGNVAYVVCPAVEENQMDVINVTEHREYLQKEYPHLKIGMLHGKMKQAEKDNVIKQFLSKKIHVLVSTTVIEVGVDVPSATLMVIENAERFGLAQLHQLRGRVGRSSLKSYCILISSSKEGNVRERLNYMTRCHDGFKISQKDLELRGPGEFFGVRQHGFNEFRFASFIDNTKVLEVTRKLAHEIVEKGYLELPEYRILKKKLEVSDNYINL